MAICLNSTVDEGKMHCITHLVNGVKSYNKYEKLCKIADTFDIKAVSAVSSAKEKIIFLNK